MQPLQKIIAGLLFTGAFICFIAAVDELKDHDITLAEKEKSKQTLTTSISLGIPAAVGGLCLLWSVKKQTNNRLRSTFYKLLKKYNGQVTVMGLAMEAQLTGTKARKYLDQQAREFNGQIGMNDDGDVFYIFNLAGME